MQRLLSIALALVFAGVASSACLATTGGEVDQAPPTGNNRPDDQPATEASEPGDEPGQDVELPFGKSYTWDDGVTLTVGKAKKFKPSDYAEVKGAKAYRRYKITVVNKSSKSLDLALTYTTVQSGNKEAGQVFDTANGLEGSPSTKLLKGRESEWDVAFGLANPDDVVMEVALQDDFERPSLIYST